MSETWRRIPGWPDYEVSDMGGFRSWRISGQHDGTLRRDQPKRHRGSLDSDGYTRIVLRDQDGARTKLGVHMAMLLAFKGPPPQEGMVPLHRDGNPSNNRLDNIRWGTTLENAADRDRHGRTCRGTRRPGAKLTEDIAAEVLRRSKEPGFNVSQLARELGVSRGTINGVVAGRTWKHVR